MNIFWWILIALFYCLHALINKYNNDLGGKWFYFSWLMAIIPIFPLVCKYSRDLLVDGMIFDAIMFISYIIVLLYLGCGETFTKLNWIGLFITIIGFILLKVK